MGIHLHNDRGASFYCSGGMWNVYREVAQEFGWAPVGTDPPRGHVGAWTGDYARDEQQRVRAADAAALARALERAVSSRELETAFFRILKRFDVLPSNEHEREYHFLGEPERLAELAEFCRGGEFEIR